MGVIWWGRRNEGVSVENRLPTTIEGSADAD
jgi:hypothetical protein